MKQMEPHELIIGITVSIIFIGAIIVAFIATAESATNKSEFQRFADRWCVQTYPELKDISYESEHFKQVYYTIGNFNKEQFCCANVKSPANNICKNIGEDNQVKLAQEWNSMEMEK